MAGAASTVFGNNGEPSVDDLFKQAEQALNAGRIDKGRILLEAIVKADPGNKDACNLLGNLALISLREIEGNRSARLGIGFGPDYVGQGYGTEALEIFVQ